MLLYVFNLTCKFVGRFNGSWGLLSILKKNIKKIFNLSLTQQGNKRVGMWGRGCHVGSLGLASKYNWDTLLDVLRVRTLGVWGSCPDQR